MTEILDIPQMMQELGFDAKRASRILAIASTEKKNEVLLRIADKLSSSQSKILAENAKDIEAGEKKGLGNASLDRLALNTSRLSQISIGLNDIAKLDDPIGSIISEWERPNGLLIQQKRVPLGVVGVIFESRPNVTADAGALCMKAGNAAILRCGSESFNSSHAIHCCMVEGLVESGLPASCIQLVPTRDRNAVGEMLNMIDIIDVIVPRGGKSLVERVTKDSKVPLFKHLEGICHTYIEGSANPLMAEEVIFNAKMRRPGICGATETILVDNIVIQRILPAIISRLIDAGCEVRGDESVQKVDVRVTPASESDWKAEYLEPIISIRAVKGIEQAIEHIERFGSSHTDAIITENEELAETFLNAVDSAIVMVNTSTQFADGAEFGMGAEIGISTGKLHARGPVGVDQLTSIKYVVRGSGQCR